MVMAPDGGRIGSSDDEQDASRGWAGDRRESDSRYLLRGAGNLAYPKSPSVYSVA